MPPQRPMIPSSVDGLHWLTTDDGSVTLWDASLNETYHSGCGAIAESLVVYVRNSGVFQRLSRGLPTRIFEVGLGTGTSLLLTAALADRFQAPLEYWTIESRLLPHSLFEQLRLADHLVDALAHNRLDGNNDSTITSNDFVAIPELTCRLAEIIGSDGFKGDPNVEDPERQPSSTANCGVDDVMQMAGELSKHVRINVLRADITNEAACRVLDQKSAYFDAIYFDAFSPTSNPRLWQADVFARMLDLLQPSGTLTTYCVKSSIRRILESVGFVVQRLPGPIGGKREVLVAQKQR